jgi:hypothetical protein
MIIETMICDKCGFNHRIETDDMIFLAKRKRDFDKQHAKCVAPKKEVSDASQVQPVSKLPLQAVPARKPKKKARAEKNITQKAA